MLCISRDMNTYELVAFKILKILYELFDRNTVILYIVS